MGVTWQGHPGSGYAVGGRLVLTSAHLVTRVGERVEVFQPGGNRTFDGRVVWCGAPDGRDDAALVLVDDDPLWRAPSGPVRWGRLVTDRPGTGCETWGLPDVAQRPVATANAPVGNTLRSESSSETDSPETEQVRGEVNPGTGMVGNKYVMYLPRDTPQWSRPGSPSPWGGLSGAAVVCDRLLIGVVAADRAHSAHGQLNVVPAYVLHHNPAFRNALAEHSGGGQGLEAVEFQNLADVAATTPPDGLASPAALLQAGRQTVPFLGREDLLNELKSWCARAGFGAWLLHGPGGQGKTRLAHQLASLLAEDSWAVLWPRPGASPDQLREIRHAAKPLLVILDYAENRLEQLTALIEAAAEHPGTTPLKVLLLARTDGDWWARAKTVSRLAEDYLGTAPARLLPPLEEQPTDRPQAYRAAALALAIALPQVQGCARDDWPAKADGLSAPRLDDDGYGNALTLHMTALADLLDTVAPAGSSARAEGNVVPQGAEGVEDRLLGHESRYWHQTAATCGLSPGLSPTSLETALAAAHLVGAADREQLDQTWRRLPALADQARDLRDSVTAWIAALYPPSAPGGSWGSLQPDRLAERHIGRVLDAGPALAEHLLHGADDTQTAQLLTLYSRAAAHRVFHGRLDTHLTGLCTRHHKELASQIIATATRTNHPEPLITALDVIATDPATPLDDLTAFSRLWPNFSSRLAPSGTRLTRAITDRYRQLVGEDPDTPLPSLAQSLHNLSLRLGEVGRHKEGLAAIQEAVRIRRALAEEDPVTFLPDLAMSLNSLFARLMGVGGHEEALAAIQEAVRIRRAFAEEDPDAFLADLAMSLDNLSCGLGKVGRHEEGLAAAQEAVSHYRVLTQADPNPNIHLPAFARSLHNLSTRYREVGPQTEGLTAIEEAVRILRTLAEANPDAHLPDFSASLDFFSVYLGEMGRQEEGLAAIQEAIRIDRVLAEANPDAFLPGFAMGLNNLSLQLGEAGRWEEGLAAVEEAACHFSVLARADPDAFLLDLVRSLNNLSRLLWEVGQWEQSLAEAQEALRYIRVLAQAYPDAHLPGLAESLHSLSINLGKVGRQEEGLVAIQEAVRIRHVLTRACPELFEDELRNSLGVAAWFESLQ